MKLQNYFNEVTKFTNNFKRHEEKIKSSRLIKTINFNLFRLQVDLWKKQVFNVFIKFIDSGISVIFGRQFHFRSMFIENINKYIKTWLTDCKFYIQTTKYDSFNILTELTAAIFYFFEDFNDCLKERKIIY